MGYHNMMKHRGTLQNTVGILEEASKDLENINKIIHKIYDVLEDINDELVSEEVSLNHNLQTMGTILKKANESKVKSLFIPEAHRDNQERDIEALEDKMEKIKVRLEQNKGRQAIDEQYVELNTVKKITTDLDKKISNINHNINEAIVEFDKFHKELESEGISGRKILETQDMERERIAREMHDGPVQSLTNLIHKTELCTKVIDKDIVRGKLELYSIMKLLRSTIDDTRDIIYDLRPMSIDDLGLSLTLERYIDGVRQDVDFKIEYTVISEEVELPSVIILTFFRVLQEALSNVLKYAKAKKVSIKLTYGDDFVSLSIIDDGVGFDLNSIETNRNTKNGFGIPMMRERVSLLSGELHISSGKDRGTEYYVTVPIIFNKEEN